MAPATTADDNGAANAAIERAAQAITDGIVYFDFDKSDIKAESRDMLRQKAELMKAYPSIRVRIEGNCDARPAVEGTGPAVWAKNRRDDFRVIAK